MKKFLAALLLVSMVGFVGCKEKSTEDKVKDAVESGKEAAGDAADKAKEALEGAK